ncbi:MAG: hypothetical protein AAF639_41720, partial [Chloroflexota bacterium]
MAMKSFSYWKIVEVEREFQIQQVKESRFLDDLMTIQTAPSDTEEKRLQQLQEELLERVYDWNETELIVNFIGPLLLMINFNQAAYRTFLDRQISVPYGDNTLSGK